MSVRNGSRQLVRRDALRVGIPESVGIPKFLTTAEVGAIKRLKSRQPALTWDEAVAVIVAQTLRPPTAESTEPE